MKQSKDEFAKKLMEMAEAYKDVGAALERGKYQKRDEMMAGMLLRVAQELLGRHGGSVNILLNRDSEPAQPQPKKRKAVFATNECVEAVFEVFQKYPNSIILPKNLHVDFGSRMVAAACRTLSSPGSGLLEMCGKRGYRLAQGKENGLDETTLPSE